MMTFYIGRDYRIYEKKWKEISESFAREMEKKGIKVTGSAIWRYTIDKLHMSLEKSKVKGVET